MSQPLDRRDPWPATDHTVDGHGLRVLDESRCFDLLGGEPIGRLGFSSGSLPVIFPVNYLLMDRTIVFCSEDGEKLRAAQQRAVACLEIDHYDRMEHTGWSVLATGRLALSPPGRQAELAEAPAAHWALSGRCRFVELPIELIAGRIVGHD